MRDLGSVGAVEKPVPVAARGGELGAPGSCADHRTCSHVRNCRYEDEGVSMGRARERAVCAYDVVWVLKGSDARRHPRPPPRRRRPPSDPRQEATSADRALPWLALQMYTPCGHSMTAPSRQHDRANWTFLAAYRG